MFFSENEASFPNNGEILCTQDGKNCFPVVKNTWVINKWKKQWNLFLIYQCNQVVGHHVVCISSLIKCAV